MLADSPCSEPLLLQLALPLPLREQTGAFLFWLASSSIQLWPVRALSGFQDALPRCSVILTVSIFSDVSLICFAYSTRFCVSGSPYRPISTPLIPLLFFRARSRLASRVHRGPRNATLGGLEGNPRARKLEASFLLESLIASRTGAPRLR